ncbi:ABC transporter ATP-binding protein [Leucobacter chinensis]|uniref:ABC transporter ATP-binding protein n=1 Tax=Leucobacter chinensis TaxID=2851010 RepID=UPI001C243BCD|nr:ABC transporter ATP-binding protein [Leucobacter chinensis]
MSNSIEKPRIGLYNVTKHFKIQHGRSLKQVAVDLVKRRKATTNFTALHNVTFEVYEGEAVAVMGRNGSGKSTTLKLLTGVLRPDSGHVRIRGKVGGLLEVGAGFDPNLTGKQNIYLNGSILGMSQAQINERYDSIVEFAELGDFLDTEIKRYSSGMRARLGFAVAVHTDLDVLLVDEALSVGDAQFRKKCHKRINEMKAQGKTMFIVTHNASQVKQLCERGIVLERGKVIFDGPSEKALQVLSKGLGAIAEPKNPAAARAVNS